MRLHNNNNNIMIPSNAAASLELEIGGRLGWEWELEVGVGVGVGVGESMVVLISIFNSTTPHRTGEGRIRRQLIDGLIDRWRVLNVNMLSDIIFSQVMWNKDSTGRRRLTTAHRNSGGHNEVERWDGDIDIHDQRKPKSDFRPIQCNKIEERIAVSIHPSIHPLIYRFQPTPTPKAQLQRFNALICTCFEFISIPTRRRSS